jgi:hypothetical protein
LAQQAQALACKTAVASRPAVASANVMTFIVASTILASRR